jgi:hypothetical protein
MNDYVFTLAKATSTPSENEMNFNIKKLTLWSQDRSLDGQGSIPSAVGNGDSLPAV